MNQLNQIPLARLAIPFITGIGICIWGHVMLSPAAFWVTSGVLLAILLITANKPVYNNVFGGAITLFMVFVGLWLPVQYMPANNPLHISKLGIEKHSCIVARIIEPPQVKEKSVKAVLKVKALQQGNEWIAATGTVIGYFEIDTNTRQLAYGDELQFCSDIQQIEQPLNPGQFNYKAYLANKGIYHQCYIKAADYTILNHNTGNTLYSLAYMAQARLLGLLHECGLQGQELAVASALLLGYDDDIDNDLIKAFSVSGTMHILSVSGMHAGLIYLVFVWLFGFLGQSAAARITRALLIIILLWAYAMLTGFSPPVIRAAIMFSLLSVASAINRHTNPVNILSAACLLMLIANPFLLADVGFQLSYIAVLGMALLYRPFYNLFEFNSRIADGIWQIVAVSIVAQLATLPLGLYYFHQFPSYFIVSNLLIIPLSTIIIYGGIILLFVSFIKPLALGVGWLVSILIQALNWLVTQNKLLPFSTIGNIRLYPIEVVLIYLVIAVLCLAFIVKNKRLLYVGMVLLCAYISGRIYQNYTIMQQHKLIVYHAGNAAAIEYIAGSESLLIADTLAVPGSNTYAFNIESAQWYLGIHNRKCIYLSAPEIEIGPSKIVIVTNRQQLDSVKNVDYLIIKKGLVSIDAIERLHPTMVLLLRKDSKALNLEDELKARHIPCYNVAKQGAFITDI